MKIKMSLIIAATVAVTALSSGCASNHFDAASSTQTAVSLKERNFHLIKAGVVGTSHGFRLLGVLPFAGANETQARANLYKNLGQSLEGKSATLANTTYSHSTVYLILFSVPKVTVEADVIEYIDSPAPVNVQPVTTFPSTVATAPRSSP
jgi:hypothetical protein